MSKELRASIKGEYQLKLLSDNEVRQETPWFSNLITNAGLDHLGTLPFSTSAASSTSVERWAHIGTGTAIPSAGDTALESPVAYTQSEFSSATRSGSYGEDESGYYFRVVHTVFRQFAAGSVVGNMSEVGIGPGGASTRDALLSRALIQDANGNPTTLTVTADDTVILVYRVTITWRVSTLAGSLTIDGDPYDYEMIPDFTATSNDSGNIYIYAVGISTNPTAGVWFNKTLANIGTPTSTVSWTSTSAATTSGSEAYVPGTYYRDSWLRTAGTNLAPTCRAFHVRARGNASGGLSNAYRVWFDPAIPIGTAQQIEFGFRASWANE